MYTYDPESRTVKHDPANGPRRIFRTRERQTYVLVEAINGSRRGADFATLVGGTPCLVANIIEATGEVRWWVNPVTADKRDVPALGHFGVAPARLHETEIVSSHLLRDHFGNDEARRSELMSLLSDSQKVRLISEHYRAGLSSVQWGEKGIIINGTEYDEYGWEIV